MILLRWALGVGRWALDVGPKLVLPLHEVRGKWFGEDFNRR
jgi:hypothetical protein